MSHKTYTNISSRTTPQNKPVLGKNQKENNAGGFVFTLDCWKRLDRFLILGSSGGTYYVSEKTLTLDNASAVSECIQKDSKRTVDVIVEISDSGRAIKNDPAIFALAMVVGAADEEGRKYALANLAKVCRIGTHLFHFAQYVEQFRGWGAGLRKGVARWYTEKPVDKLQLQLVKYRQRDGWSHRDLLRLAHPKTNDKVLNAALKWAVAKEGVENIDSYESILPLIWAYEQLGRETNEKRIIKLITEYRLPMEAVASEKQTKAVLEALLPNMGLTGIIRNLGSYTSKEILTQTSETTAFVLDKLLSAEGIKKARVHPITLLAALMTYNQGHGLRGNLTWSPVGRIVDALDSGFYLAFENVIPTLMRFFLGLDVSGSMGASMLSTIPNMSARDASAALAMVTMAIEKNWSIYGFTSGHSAVGYHGYSYGSNDAITPLKLSPKMRLTEVIQTIKDLDFGRTDCALPMLEATAKKIPVDAFVIYTDNETWHGNIHPFQALKQYRQTMGINAKLIVVGMTSTEFTIADPSDAGMLDVVGFDTNTPSAISDFAAGKI
jgi:60 kDa SS-A/Ro ribonucleoprotein